MFRRFKRNTEQIQKLESSSQLQDYQLYAFVSRIENNHHPNFAKTQSFHGRGGLAACCGGPFQGELGTLLQVGKSGRCVAWRSQSATLSWPVESWFPSDSKGSFWAVQPPRRGRHHMLYTNMINMNIHAHIFFSTINAAKPLLPLFKVLAAFLLRFGRDNTFHKYKRYHLYFDISKLVLEHICF